jgi:2-keto-3-deoxy-6-phosphogluconate aldolase
LVSSGTATLAAAATSGASLVENLAAKTAIKVTAKVGAALINNTVKVNTTDGVKVHNVKDVLKNTAIDLAADGVSGKLEEKLRERYLKLA